MIVLSPRTLSVTNSLMLHHKRSASLCIFTHTVGIPGKVREILFAILTRKICKTPLWIYTRPSVGRSVGIEVHKHEKHSLRYLARCHQDMGKHTALHHSQPTTKYSMQCKHTCIYLTITYNAERSSPGNLETIITHKHTFRMENSISDVLQVL